MAVDAGALTDELATICPGSRALDPARDADLAIDGMLASCWSEPASADELAAVLRVAADRGLAVLPRGGGTRMALGNVARRADILLSTRGLNRVVEYEPADLTVTVESGVVLHDLQRRLNGEGQFLALDPPSGDRATVGGIVASNASGPIRLQYGSARDLVIGTRIANADGVLTKAGGRVVKNVAGYDLNKLYTGSLGTLGVIVELSFKLHPLPQHQASVLAAFRRPEDADGVVRALMRSPLGPTAIEVLDAGATAVAAPETDLPEEGCLLLVLASGFELAVDRVARDVADMCRQHATVKILAAGPEHERIWMKVRELADASDSNRALIKLAVPPATSIAGFQHLRARLREQELAGHVVGRAGVGLVYASAVSSTWNESELQRLAAAVADARGFALEHQGSLVIESCPPPLKQLLDAWGEVGPPLRLMRALKAQLDPRDTLNPGRYVGGI